MLELVKEKGRIYQYIIWENRIEKKLMLKCKRKKEKSIKNEKEKVLQKACWGV